MNIPDNILWHKSSHSGGTCVEVGHVPDGVLVRHSLRPNDGTIKYTNAEWAAFVEGVRDGELD